MGNTTIEARRRFYARHFQSKHHHNPGQSVQVPADVERREEHAPCFNCGVRANVPCRHRPWMLAS